MSKYEVFLVRNFLHSDWIRRDTEYLSVFSPNAGKYGPENNSVFGHFSRSETAIFQMSFKDLLILSGYFTFSLSFIVFYIIYLQGLIQKETSPLIFILLYTIVVYCILYYCNLHCIDILYIVSFLDIEHKMLPHTKSNKSKTRLSFF